ncbi:DNA methyltransferase [Ascidiimonas sp. W6]|uniref:DNA methyltransferase n=1 Tax=Ascidiimonas meishanensis TaxID=3128903 RepID=UPI0030EF001A
MNELELEWHKYKYFEYEKELAYSEIETLLCPKEIITTKKGVKLIGNFDAELAKRLVYFSKINNEENISDTIQSELESSQVLSESKKRQFTRYSVHGLHEYKGKFNPQIVKSILNIFDAKKGDRLLDPFCGSGTSLCESSLMGIQAEGTDINPMAVYLSNAKISALNTNSIDLETSFLSIQKKWNKKDIELNEENERIKYLLKWFPRDILIKAEQIKIYLNKLPKSHSTIFLALVSDMLREYSLQEPRDLRIRKRKSPMPDIPFEKAIEDKVFKFLTVLKNAQKITGVLNTDSFALLKDNRTYEESLHLNKDFKKYDLAITSPPYAMALPYIDTQRLSLVWLGLSKASDIKSLEASLTGSRELNTKAKKEKALDNLKSNSNLLPTETHHYCLSLEKSIGIDDGFRRRAVPLLLYKYFSDMKMSFISIKRKLKIGGYYALIVGHNKTTLGGTTFHIETPQHLAIIAEQNGWKIKEMIPLQTYKRYELHSANAINSETLIILENND